MTEPVVTLRDGRQVSSGSEAWRFECEARTICRVATVAQRRARLDAIEKVRGTAARDVLADEVRAIWEAERRPELERLRREGLQ